MRRLIVSLSLVVRGRGTRRRAGCVDVPRRRLARRSMSGRPARRRSLPRNASYTISARLDPGDPDHHRHAKPSPGGTSPPAPAADLQFHLYWNAWKNTDRPSCASARSAAAVTTGGARADEWGRIDVTALTVDGVDRSDAHSGSSPRTTATPDDETVMSVPLPQPIRAGRHARRSRSRGRPTCRGPSRAPAPSAISSSSRSGSRNSACCRTRAGTAISSTPAPSSSPTSASTTCADGPARLAARRNRRAARAPRQRRRHDDPPLLPGRRPRLRLDDEPRLPRTDGAVRAPGAAAGRDAAAAAARARRPGRAALRRDAHDAALLRRMVRRISLRPHHDRRSRLPERRRRDGYPTLFTAGTRWLAPRGVTTPEGGHGPRGRPPVLVRHGRQQRIRGRVDGRGLQHVLHRARRWRRSTSPTTSRCATSAASCRGCSRTSRCSRETDGNRLAGYRRDAKIDVQSTPSLPLLAVDAAAASPTTRPRCG